MKAVVNGRFSITSMGCEESSGGNSSHISNDSDGGGRGDTAGVGDGTMVAVMAMAMTVA